MGFKRRKSYPTQMGRLIDRGALSSKARTNQTKKYIYLLFHWKEIVGKRNSKIMAPLAIQKNSLVIAVPNSMVKHSVFPTLPLLLKKIHDQGTQFDDITFLRLQVQTAVFPKKRKLKAEQDRTLPEPSEDNLQVKIAELIEDGVSEELAPHLARLFCLTKTKES